MYVQLKYRRKKCLGIWIDNTEFSDFIGSLLRAGVLNECIEWMTVSEYTENFWDVEKDIAIFRATISLQWFFYKLRVLRLMIEKHDPAWDKRINLHRFINLWDIWMEVLPKSFNSSAYFRVIDEQLVSFKVNCPFRQCMR